VVTSQPVTFPCFFLHAAVVDRPGPLRKRGGGEAAEQHERREKILHLLHLRLSTLVGRLAQRLAEPHLCSVVAPRAEGAAHPAELKSSWGLTPQ
jgi:hypothetical protein